MSISASPLPPLSPSLMSQTSIWDFWDPFVPSAPFAIRTEEWEKVTTITVFEAVVTTSANITAPRSVVSGLKMASGSELVSRDARMASFSSLLGVAVLEEYAFTKGKVYNHWCNLTSPSSWSWSLSGMGKMAEEIVISSSNIGGEIGGFNHSPPWRGCMFGRRNCSRRLRMMRS
ncbi:hypothetical protein LINPERHAP2_LOCUS36833 [Linum perenne]